MSLLWCSICCHCHYCHYHIIIFLNIISVFLSIIPFVQAHSQSISCLATHPTKPVVASSSDDQLWGLWGLPEGDQIATGEGHTDWLSGVSFHPDETKLGTTGGDGSLRIWDVTLGRLVLTLQGHTGATWGCSFHSCGNFVASCSTDHTIKVG